MRIGYEENKKNLNSFRKFYFMYIKIMKKIIIKEISKLST